MTSMYDLEICDKCDGKFEWEDFHYLCKNCYQEFINELEQLREEKKTWLKICAFEKKKWMEWYKALPHLASAEEKEHIEDFYKLLDGDK